MMKQARVKGRLVLTSTATVHTSTLQQSVVMHTSSTLGVLHRYRLPFLNQFVARCVCGLHAIQSDTVVYLRSAGEYRSVSRTICTSQRLFRTRLLVLIYCPRVTQTLRAPSGPYFW